MRSLRSLPEQTNAEIPSNLKLLSVVTETVDDDDYGCGEVIAADGSNCRAPVNSQATNYIWLSVMEHSTD